MAATQHPLEDSHCLRLALQCHIQPSGSLAAPMLEVTSLLQCVAPSGQSPVVPTFFVLSLVASFSKVPMMSETWQKQSSPFDLMNSSCLAHSWHAHALVSSGCPAPLGSSQPTASVLRKLTPAAKEKLRTRQRVRNIAAKLKLR